MSICLIISGGDFNPLPSTIKYDYVIACDHGIDHAHRLNIAPDLIIGDFDSYVGESLDFGDTPVLQYPVEKDDSDTMLAIKYALSHGYNHIILTCAMGGRFDHAFANIQSMAFIANMGGICELYSSTEYMRTFTGPDLYLPKGENCSLSLFALSDSCDNLSIYGSKYEVSNTTLTNRFPLGLSNCWKEDKVHISMTSGILLIIESKM